MVKEPLRGGWREMKGKRYRFRISKGRGLIVMACL